MSTSTLNKEDLFDCLIVDGIQVPQNVLQNALDDDGVSLYTIGKAYQDNGIYDKAIGWYHLGAAKNHAGSQFKLGWMHNKGKGITMNFKLAMEWYLKAYNNRHPEAANNIGLLYFHGQGLNRNYKIALEWFLKAADKGSTRAQYNVGFVYQNGFGVELDKQYALEWYEKSAEQGDQEAKVIVKLLNDQGLYSYARQKKYLEIEKDLESQKSKIESLENRLKASEQKQLAFDYEIKLLKQENQVLKLKSQMDTKDQVALKKDVTQQIVEGHSKKDTNWASSNITKDSNTDDENPENDICYDQ